MKSKLIAKNGRKHSGKALAYHRQASTWEIKVAESEARLCGERKSNRAVLGRSSIFCTTWAGEELAFNRALTNTLVSSTTRIGYVIDSLISSCTWSFDKFCKATLRCIGCMISKADSFFASAKEFNQNCTNPESFSLSAFESFLATSASESGNSSMIVCILLNLHSKITKNHGRFNTGFRQAFCTRVTHL
jgi:hypothetical protein